MSKSVQLTLDMINICKKKYNFKFKKLNTKIILFYFDIKSYFFNIFLFSQEYFFFFLHFTFCLHFRISYLLVTQALSSGVQVSKYCVRILIRYSNQLCFNIESACTHKDAIK